MLSAFSSFTLFSALLLAGCGGASSHNDQQCQYGGRAYDPGQRFPAEDGCNTCSCEADGRASCSLLGCESCDSVNGDYAGAIEDAKKCDPEATGQCSKLVTEGLVCGCETFVNHEQTAAIGAIAAAEQRYSSLSCGGTVQCGPCQVPTSAYCSSAGRCESIPAGNEPACKVAGVIYNSGATGIPDPFSCNECQCLAGELLCTEIGCEVPCPAGTLPSEQCAQCGPTDACNVVEHGCLPACAVTCDNGACIEGICKTVCG